MLCSRAAGAAANNNEDIQQQCKSTRADGIIMYTVTQKATHTNINNSAMCFTPQHIT